MFLDLRTASVTKPNKFTDALIEYLTTELKNNNVKCRKKVSYIDVKIDKPIENKYSKLIVDCFDGNVYLRGENVNDKQVLKMRRFNLGNRESDALYCAKGACKQIERYLKKINSVETETKEVVARMDLRSKLKRTATTKSGNEVVDLRSKVVRSKALDLRGKVVRAEVEVKDKKNTKVAYNRDYAVTIVDGKVYAGDTHGECVTKFLQEMGIEDIEFYDRIDLRENLGFNFYSQFAAAHVDGDNIYLDKMSLENITEEQAVGILKANFPDLTICDYDTREKIAEFFDFRNRDAAILYFNGKMLEGFEH